MSNPLRLALKLFLILHVFVWSWCLEAATAPEVSDKPKCSGLIGDSVSVPSLAFLELLDLGLVNLGSDLPELFVALRRLVGAVGPVNPFVNLSSPLALALAGRSEQLLSDLNSDWGLIRKVISQRIQNSATEESLRAQDESDTRSVSDMFKVDLLLDSFPPRIEDLHYIGETEHAIIFGIRDSRWLPRVRDLMGSIYRLSKSTREFTLLDKVNVPDAGYEETQWMHNGFVYGFAYPDVPKYVQPPHEARIFRLDPETGERKWADPWMQIHSDRSSTRIAYRLHVSNSVIGIEVEDPRSAIGEVYKFDYDRLQFQATGLRFDETTLAMYQKPGGSNLSDVAYVGSSNRLAMKIGMLLKTNGQSIATIGDSQEWRHWSVSGVVRTAERTLGRLKFELRLYENVSSFETNENSNDGRKRKDRGPIKLLFRGQYPKSSYESVDRGESIVYLANAGSESPLILLLIDRHAWTASPIELMDGPPAIGKGKWRLVRNQSDDLLLRFDYDQEVALWKFNPTTRRFESVLHEVLGQTYIRYGVTAHIDYENLKLIAWGYTDHEENQTMWASLPEELVRENTQLKSQKGSLP